jgi:hypothetical protein
LSLLAPLACPLAGWNWPPMRWGAEATVLSKPLIHEDSLMRSEGGLELRTHRARHDKSKEFGALSNPLGLSSPDSVELLLAIVGPR